MLRVQYLNNRFSGSSIVTQASPETTDIASILGRKKKIAASLLEKWMLEDDGYDDRVWPVLEQALKDGAMCCRDTLN
jgi:hypothetical protein